jgi:hypothetical protein
VKVNSGNNGQPEAQVKARQFRNPIEAAIRQNSEPSRPSREVRDRYEGKRAK